jgi:phage baseplate assembly protein W
MDEQLRGFAFPFRIRGGSIARAQGFEKVAQDLRHLLSTRLGERPMLRTYGGGVHHRLQEANDSTLHALIKHEIEQGLRIYLPAVQLTAPIQVISLGEELTVTIEYRANPRAMIDRLELRIG